MKIKSKNKNIPKLRFPEFEEEWGVETLNSLTTRIGDGIHSTPEYDDNGSYFFINGNNLVDGKIKIFNTTKKVEESEAEKHNRELSDRTILLSINGTIGNLAFYNNEKVMLGKSAAYLNIKNEIDKEFVYNVLKITETQNFFFSELTGSTIKNLSLKTIRETKISIPTKSEQTKIANFLTAVDKRINLLQKKKEKLEQYKKGIMQKIFSQSLRFKDDNGNDFPDWEVKMLGDIATFFSGGTPRSTNKKFYSGKISFIGSGDISKEKVKLFITDEAFRSCSAKMVKKGDILYALYGATSGEVAISKMNGAINQAVLCIRTNENKYLIREVLNFNKGKIVSKYLQGGQGNLSATIIRNLKLIIPNSIEEQQKIANFLSSIDKRITNEELQIKKMQNWKKGLLQKMFV